MNPRTIPLNEACRLSSSIQREGETEGTQAALQRQSTAVVAVHLVCSGDRNSGVRPRRSIDVLGTRSDVPLSIRDKEANSVVNTSAVESFKQERILSVQLAVVLWREADYGRCRLRQIGLSCCSNFDRRRTR